MSIFRCLRSLWAPGLALFVLVEAVLVLTISKAKGVDGSLMYNTATVVLVVEVIKFLASAALLWPQDPGFKTFRSTLSFTNSLPNAAPALLYAINNNIYILVLTTISPSIFQLLLNTRVVWTGLIFWLVLRRRVTPRQWLAVVVLVAGCSLAPWFDPSNLNTAQFSSIASVAGLRANLDIDETGMRPADVAATSAWSPFVQMMGLTLTLIYTLISTAAGVVNEVLLKASANVNAGNMLLYAYGALFNAAALLYQGANIQGGYFRGWENPEVWCIVVLMAVNGLVVSRVMKQYDSIVKIYCVSVCNCVVYLYSVLVDGVTASVFFFIAFALVSWSARTYQSEATKSTAEDKSLDLAKRRLDQEISNMGAYSAVNTITDTEV